MTSGFKIAQAGADVKTAASYEYVATSEWPILPILKEGPINISTSSSDVVTVYEHNLGYYCPFLIMNYVASLNGSNYDYDTSRMNASTSLSFYMDKNKLVYRAPANFKGYFYIFDYDMDNLFTPEPNKSGISTKAAKGKYGIKTPLKPGYGAMESTDLSDYAVNTDGRALSVHTNGRQTAIDSGAATARVVVEHNLGYLPSYLFFKESDLGIRHESNLVTANEKTITIKGAQAPLSGVYYYLIYKEPFLINL